jgi:ribose/xylose/arabinose/galactoside ABC-type transport system permease subunit
VAVGRIEAIVATLGTLIVLRGLNQGVLPSTWAQPSARFQRWGTATHLGVSTAIWLALGAAAAGIALLAQTRAGRRVYAVGSNAGAAELAGVDERRMSFLVMVWSGLMVGVASLAFAPQFSIIQPGSSDGLEILIITAVLIGGTSIFGGKGSVLGAVLGVVLISLVRTALVYYHVPSIWEQAAYGTALLLAVSVDVVRGRRAPATRAAT